MDRNVTQEEIIKFVYGELSFSDTAELYDRIDAEPESQQDLETYAAMKFELDRLMMSPSSKAIKNILTFSENF